MRLLLRVTATSLYAAAFLLADVSARRLQEPDNIFAQNEVEEVFHVMLRTTRGHVPTPLQHHHHIRSFQKLQSISTVVTRQELQELQDDPKVLEMEEDVLVFPDFDTEDATLFSMPMIQAESQLFSKSAAASTNVPRTAACNDPRSFKIGVRSPACDLDRIERQCLAHFCPLLTER